ncbi:IS481 family transposase [Rhodanobacter sp. AS-Z3]|uniref:IS481 family transposase n=1 Tax=Rhodanobacter sp. AS-Z3 TaxID=3031330 RepID=UPI0024789FE0|nr:IS481 family transposase [Rhodanobacter sp. AS-Z3]WEN15089.1 IS481 family transposase [Rhodanobacter sp. AS-Z3]
MTLTLHPLARTTPRILAELRAEEPGLSDAALARRYGVTAPTVRKWRERDSTADRSHRPDTLHCTLTPAQEAVAMEVRRTLWLPLDDLLVIVREFLNPKVSRSGLARCMKRHGVNQRPVEDKDAPIVRKTFKDYAPGFVHMDIKYLPQMADETARRYLFVAIDRATRWVYLRIYGDQSEASSTDFLRRVKAAAPMTIEKLLTDNGSQFTDRFTSKRKEPSGHHAFDRECALLGIEHRLITPRHPQTNGMVERFNGRISDILATTHFRSREDLQTTLERYQTLYNEHLPQKALGHKTPVQAIRAWRKERPELFVRKLKNQTELDNSPPD